MALNSFMDKKSKKWILIKELNFVDIIFHLLLKKPQMVNFTIEEIRKIMDNQDRIRNMSVIATSITERVPSLTPWSAKLVLSPQPLPVQPDIPIPEKTKRKEVSPLNQLVSLCITDMMSTNQESTKTKRNI